ncbi:MAG TPA: hypothetical protein VNX21_08955 [Candidatus Thermoplasmatota archaeon]|nr:hypothetical protein [Candidatus Thermoplasmatota archaeon]
MRSTFLEDADAAVVAHTVRRVLDARGVLVREHASARVRFLAQAPDGRWSWTREGYVGIYQPYGERDVEVRLILRARAPYRLFWGTAATVLLLSALTLLANPPGTTWFLVAFTGGLALLVATLLYMNTWRPVREEERALLAAFEEEFQREGVAAALEREEEHASHAMEADLEAEVERRRLEREAKAAKAAAPRPARKLPAFRLRKP